MVHIDWRPIPLDPNRKSGKEIKRDTILAARNLSPSGLELRRIIRLINNCVTRIHLLRRRVRDPLSDKVPSFTPRRKKIICISEDCDRIERADPLRIRFA